MSDEKFWLDALKDLDNEEIERITTREEFDKLEEQLKNQREELRRAEAEELLNNTSDEASDETTDNEEEAESEEISVDDYMEMMEEELSSAYLVRGATLKCSCGSHERKLNVLKDHGVYIKGKPMIHELDMENEKNITYFGVCDSDSKYLDTESVTLELDVKDENGEVVDTKKVTGSRCEPYILCEWMDTKDDVRIVDNGDKDPEDKLKDGNDVTKGHPVVTMNSFLVCRHGGIIEPLTSGQELEEDDEEEVEEFPEELEEIINEEYGFSEEEIEYIKDLYNTYSKTIHLITMKRQLYF